MCKICRIVAGQTQRSFDRPIFESPSYFAIVSVGALVPGWLLIFPKEHTPNLRDHYARGEFIAFRREVASSLQDHFFEPVRMFEHGPVSENSKVGCGVDHAHLHLVPLSFSLETLAHADASEKRWIKARASDIPSLSVDQEYLVCGDHPSEPNPGITFATLQRPESQYFRRLIATQLGRSEEFDYNAHMQLPTVNETGRVLTKAA